MATGMDALNTLPTLDRQRDSRNNINDSKNVDSRVPDARALCLLVLESCVFT